MHYGMGFQAGVYYTPNCEWSFGASYKSPQWFEGFQFLSTDELGLPRRLTLSADFPMITSIGLAYRGIPGLVVASDVRYIDYDNASTFGDPARFNPDGSVAGLGWRSVFSVSVGGQYQLTDSLSLRLGYTATENAIPDAVAGFNLQSAALWQHGVMAGASLEVNSNIVLLIGYVHVFEKSIDSQLQTPLGPIPNSRIVHSVETDALVLGLTVRF
jgi:long-chain fatty acid transport protein